MENIIYLDHAATTKVDDVVLQEWGYCPSLAIWRFCK